MHIRYIVLVLVFLFASILVTQTATAHPPNLHNEAAQEQTQTKDTVAEHDEQAMEDHHEDGTEAQEHSHEADGHDESAGTEEHSHEAGGHDEAGGESGGHSHWGISPDSSPFSKVMAAFGKFHPLIVHFPIALFLSAAFAQVLNMRTKDGAYDKTVSLLVWLGTFGALGAGLLGWAHSGPVQLGENAVMSSHRWIGTSLLIGGMITAYVMTKARKTKGGLRASKAFNLLLFAMALGVAVNGFLGGSLAHGGIKHLMPGMM
ncbi:MAG: hypothetical protein COB36_13385 [Alphaproteobacteria bacterium]|nr:MAG: hypothetical protein COB36_13385 [Alphaproteobacteria bacterium]